MTRITRMQAGAVNHEDSKGHEEMEESSGREGTAELESCGPRGGRGRRPAPSANSERERVAVRRDEAELYQVVIECRDEEEQRELFERLRGEGRRVRLLVL